MVRLALIGCGGHSGRGHAPPLARFATEHPDVLTLAAVCDLQIERAKDYAKRFGFAAAYSDMDEMLDRENLDGVVCIMAVSQIVPISGRLLQRGMPCVIEKPLGNNPTEARQLAEIASQTGTPHMVSLNRRFIPLLNRGLEWAKAHGPIRYVRGTMLRDRRVEPEFLWATGIHAIDAMRHICGEVSDYTLDTPQSAELTSTWRCAKLKFASGAVGRLDIMPTAGIDEEAYEIVGEGYRVLMSSLLPRGMGLRCWHLGQQVVDDTMLEPHDAVRGEYDEVVEFVSALQNKRNPRPSITDVLPSIELCWAMQHEQD